MIALELTPFEATPERRQVELRIDAGKAHAGVVRELAALVREYPGEAPVVLALETSSGPKRLAFGPEYKVRPSPTSSPRSRRSSAKRRSRSAPSGEYGAVPAREKRRRARTQPA